MQKYLILALALSALLCTTTAFAANLCAGKAPGSVTFFKEEISRDAALPKPVSELNFSGPMWALLCLPETVGPQQVGGKKFRIVLYVKAIEIADGKYSSYSQAKQDGGILRPALSAARKDIIVFINEDFNYDSLKAKLDPGTYEFRLQAASEKATGKVDMTIDWNNDVAYFQELRKAGYLADGKVKIVVQ